MRSSSSPCFPDNYAPPVLLILDLQPIAAENLGSWVASQMNHLVQKKFHLQIVFEPLKGRFRCSKHFNLELHLKTVSFLKLEPKSEKFQQKKLSQARLPFRAPMLSCRWAWEQSRGRSVEGSVGRWVKILKIILETWTPGTSMTTGSLASPGSLGPASL